MEQVLGRRNANCGKGSRRLATGPRRRVRAAGGDGPATGRSFRIVGAGVGEVRDGQIVHVTEYWNMADFLGQVGALPPRAG